MLAPLEKSKKGVRRSACPFTHMMGGLSLTMQSTYTHDN